LEGVIRCDKPAGFAESSAVLDFDFRWIVMHEQFSAQGAFPETGRQPMAICLFFWRQDGLQHNHSAQSTICLDRSVSSGLLSPK